MKLKQLREILSDVETFSSPNFKLEQYPTGPEIAAHGIFFFPSVRYPLSNDNALCSALHYT